MTWENAGSPANIRNGTTVVAVQNGNERPFTFDGNMLLQDVVREVSSKMSYGSVLVNCDGRTVEPTEGTKPISSFGKVEIIPKFSGAM